MTDVHPTGSKEPTRRSTRLQGLALDEQAGRNPTLDPEEVRIENGADSGSNREHLLKEIARLQAELSQLRLSESRASEAACLRVPTESPPTPSQQPLVTRFPSETPSYPTIRPKLSERTPNIDDLDNGNSPTFKQWQASIQDRLEINSDHYRSERARMALVWGHTTGLAKEYLEPRYLSDTDQERFRNAEDMIALLKSYFITGNEQSESRSAFDRLLMDKNETFSTFKARFLSAAIKGQVPQSEWFHYLWVKLTPALRMPNLGFKRQWNDKFELMVEHLTAFDNEKNQAPELPPATLPGPQRLFKPPSERNRSPV